MKPHRMKQSLKVDAASAGKRIDLVVGDTLGLSDRVKLLFESGAIPDQPQEGQEGLWWPCTTR